MTVWYDPEYDEHLLKAAKKKLAKKQEYLEHIIQQKIRARQATFPIEKYIKS